MSPILITICLSLTSAPGEQGRFDFEKKIRPVLAQRCYRCHSAEAALEGKLKGELQLDTREGLQQGGASGAVLVPGRPDQSRLIEALKYENENLQMPPMGKLPEEIVADFVRWVALGATIPKDSPAVTTNSTDLESKLRHWAYRPLRVVSPPLPEANSSEDAWQHSPIDRFILAKQREKRLHPAREADRQTLLRRAYFDLLGLPPAPEEVDAFVRNPSQNTFPDLVDSLLASPHYGERWGRHWLDVARFGESTGAHNSENDIQKDAYRYRNAVIHAFNEDMPYDKFVRYQIAGASKDSPAVRQDLGMFLHLGTNLSGASNPNDRKFHRLDDMVSTTGQAFLALTVECARCHDHKIDPITAEEYYQLTAVFFDVAKVKPDAGGKYIPLKVTTPHLLAGGSWQNPVKPVEPGFLRVLMRDGRTAKDWQHDPQAADGPDTKSDTSKQTLETLANWLTDVKHGAGALSARVVVNRVWQHHFGRGIVSTPNDFGELGADPAHPALLDWLAAKLIQEGWHLKPIHRLIMNSATYKQAASAELVQAQRDADNQYLWHQMPLRMEAEVIRDHILSVSGALRTGLYRPSIPIGSRETPFKDTQDTWHRSIYLMSPRLIVHPVLKIFDFPDSSRSVGARSISTTPSSAAFMLNAPFVWEQASLFAQRVRGRVGDDPDAQIELAYRIALSRPPTMEERQLGLSFLRQPPVGDVEEKAVAQLDVPNPLVQYCHTVMSLNEFIYVH